jgi:hypothetical protein
MSSGYKPVLLSLGPHTLPVHKITQNIIRNEDVLLVLLHRHHLMKFSVLIGYLMHELTLLATDKRA